MLAAVLFTALALASDLDDDPRAREAEALLSHAADYGADLVAQLQGRLPHAMHLVLGDGAHAVVAKQRAMMKCLGFTFCIRSPWTWFDRETIARHLVAPTYVVRRISSGDAEPPS